MLIDEFERERYSCAPSIQSSARPLIDVELEDVPGDLLRADDVLQGVEIGLEVGAGGFGRVYQGTWQGFAVAVKQVHNDTTAALGQRRRALLSEAQVLGQINHKHVVIFYGVARARNCGAWLLVTEFVSGGDLRHALYPKVRSCALTLRDKMDIVIGIAAGLWHLDSKGITYY